MATSHLKKNRFAAPDGGASSWIYFGQEVCDKLSQAPRQPRKPNHTGLRSGQIPFTILPQEVPQEFEPVGDHHQGVLAGQRAGLEGFGLVDRRSGPGS